MRNKLNTTQLLELHRLEIRMYTARKQYESVKHTNIEKRYKVRLTALKKAESKYCELVRKFKEAA